MLQLFFIVILTNMNECLEHGYTLHHCPRDDGRRGGGVVVLCEWNHCDSRRL